MPAHLQFENGGESVALIPTRYPGSEASPRRPDRPGAQDRCGKRSAPDAHRGLGQRIFATDADDVPLLDVRTITLDRRDEADARSPATDHA